MRKKIAFIGTYLPRKCGIATFTYNLFHSICKKENDCLVVALNDEEETYNYPPEVGFQIRQNHVADYVAASEFLNLSDVETVFIQHEFGIYGGDHGHFIIQLMKRLKMPVVTTLHTVIDEPSAEQTKTVKEIAQYSSKIIVMSETGKKMLSEIYNIQWNKIEVIGHGIPDPDKFRFSNYKEELGIESKKVLLTFGLLSKTKGIEVVLQALPKIVREHPDTVYIVLGATHPNVIKQEGEIYRNSLKKLIRVLNIEDHVIFIDHFVSQEELFGFLQISDIYVIPYLSKKQITSGTLVYAMATDNAVISTPFWHAEEALAEGRGLFFEFGDSKVLAKTVNVLLDDDEMLNNYREKASNYARNYLWENIGEQYVLLSYKIHLSKLQIINKLIENEKVT